VGAGPVGLSLALGLARQGVKTLILEKEPYGKPLVRAFGLHMRTLEIFRGWGVLDRVMAAGTHLGALRMWRAGIPANLGWPSPAHDSWPPASDPAESGTMALWRVV